MQWETETGKLFGVSPSLLGALRSFTPLQVLDEAHKVLTSSDAARLTRSIASIIRQQRHLATRVVIATQEPTVIPRTVLDLALFVACHRFSSPAWCRHLAKHVSAGSDQWLEDVMMLETGEALVFSAASLVSVPGEESGTRLLGRDCLRVRVRPRLTSDGGASVMAIRTSEQNITVTALGALPLTPTESPSDTPDTSAHDFLLSGVTSTAEHSAISPASSSSHSLSEYSTPVLQHISLPSLSPPPTLISLSPPNLRMNATFASERVACSTGSDPISSATTAALSNEPLGPPPDLTSTAPPTTATSSLNSSVLSIPAPRRDPLTPTVRFRALLTFLGQQKATGITQVSYSCQSGDKGLSGILWRSTGFISISCGRVRGRAGAARRSPASSMGLTRATVCVYYLITSTHVPLTLISAGHKLLPSFLKLASQQPQAASCLLPPSPAHPTF